MRGVSLLGACAFLLLASAPVRSEEKKDKFDAAKLVGEWTVVSGEKEGTKSEADHLKGKIEIGKDTIKITSGEDGDMVFLMKYKLDASKKPISIVIEGTEGPVKDQTVKGILELDGDNLKFAYALPDTEAPKGFKTKEGDKTHSFVLKRVKKEKKEEKKK